MPGKIIVLNGTSSAGKSTVGTELKNIMHDYFLTSIDDFMRGLPDSMHGDTDYSDLTTIGCHTKFSEDRQRILDFTVAPKGYLWLGHFLRGIDAFCNEKVGIIFDMIVSDDTMLKFVAEHLRRHEVYYVGVRCAEAVRKAREISRGDRMSGMYLLNAEYVYQQSVYDIEVDTSHQSGAAAAAAIKQQLETVEPLVFPQVISQLNQNGS